MSKVVTLFLLGALLALFKAALQVLIVVLLISLIYAFATRPRETLWFVATLTICGLANARPTAAIICLGVVGVIGALSGTLKPKPETPLLLNDQSQRHIT